MEISIRHAEPSDYEAVQRIFAGPRAIRGTLQLPFPSLEQSRKRLAEPREGVTRLVAAVDDEIVGILGLHTYPKTPRRRHAGYIGMSVRDDWHGRGVGTALMEAAVDLAENWLNLERIELTVFTDNAPAIGLYEKFGFMTEGTLRKYAFRDGEYVDVYTMARLRE